MVSGGSMIVFTRLIPRRIIFNKMSSCLLVVQPDALVSGAFLVVKKKETKKCKSMKVKYLLSAV